MIKEFKVGQRYKFVGDPRAWSGSGVRSMRHILDIGFITVGDIHSPEEEGAQLKVKELDSGFWGYYYHDFKDPYDEIDQIEEMLNE